LKNQCHGEPVDTNLIKTAPKFLIRYIRAEQRFGFNQIALMSDPLKKY
jgi:hypothetical protein